MPFDVSNLAEKCLPLLRQLSDNKLNLFQMLDTRIRLVFRRFEHQTERDKRLSYLANKRQKVDL